MFGFICWKKAEAQKKVVFLSLSIYITRKGTFKKRKLSIMFHKRIQMDRLEVLVNIFFMYGALSYLTQNYRGNFFLFHYFRMGLIVLLANCQLNLTIQSRKLMHCHCPGPQECYIRMVKYEQTFCTSSRPYMNG